jgi:hypothetical protein
MEDLRDCSSCKQSYPRTNNIHAFLCPALQQAGPAPGDNYILGILFHQDSPSATAEWVKCDKSTDDETSISFQSVDVTPCFSAGAVPEAIYTERNPRRNRDTASMLEIWTVPASEAGGKAAPNQGIAAAADGLETHHTWMGPVLALAMTRATGFMVDPGQYKNVSLEDCGDVVDYLLDFGNPEHGERLRAALNSLGTRAEDNVRDVSSVDGEDKPPPFNEIAGGENEDGRQVFEM